LLKSWKLQGKIRIGRMLSTTDFEEVTPSQNLKMVDETGFYSIAYTDSETR